MKTICIIQARMGSERLPGKVIKELCGKPMIVHIVERLSKSKLIDDIVVATSTDECNDVLEDILNATGIKCFRGSEDDVLTRYIDTVERYGGDNIIRVTGDCPLVSYEIIDELIQQFIQSEKDYMRVDVPDTICRGFDAEIFTKDALHKVDSLANIQRYREHVTLYMYQHPNEFSISKCILPTRWQTPDYRLTVDTVQDFELIEKIYAGLYADGTYMNIEDIINFIDCNQKLIQINSDIEQKHV